MASLRAVNPDGTPFYVNLRGPVNGLVIDIGDAYILAEALRKIASDMAHQARVIREQSVGRERSESETIVLDTMVEAESDLLLRANGIERYIDAAKSEQAVKAGAHWTRA